MEQTKNKQEFSYLIKNGRENTFLLIYLQPIYSIEEGKFSAAEVLVRIKDGDTIIAPDHFIGLAEDYDIIHELDLFVFEAACKFLSKYGIENLGLNYLEVNMSVKTGEIPSIADEYLALIEKYKLSPYYFNIEVTESVHISDMHTLEKNMIKMMLAGVSFSLDDFGNGERELDCVIDLPVTIIKFDSTIVKVCDISHRLFEIILSVIKMIHSLGMKVVAEGIEDEGMFNKMKKAKVDYIQGYYMSKPMPENEFVKFIHQKNEEKDAN